MCMCVVGVEKGLWKVQILISPKRTSTNEKMQEVEEACINILYGDTEVNIKISKGKIQNGCHLEAGSGMAESLTEPLDTLSTEPAFL